MEVFIWIVVILIFIGAIYFFYSIISKSAKTAARQSKAKEELGSTINTTMIHVDGLPVAQDVSTEVYYCPDKIVFKASGQEITLNRDKIFSIDVSVGSNVASTATGAIAGKYIVGGLSGAVIGALVATKTYCIISYEKDGNNKFIVLDTGLSGTAASKMAKDFKSSSTSWETKKIEL